MAILSPEGTNKPPFALRKPSRVAPRVLKVGAAGQRRGGGGGAQAVGFGPGSRRLGAAHLLRSRGQGHRGPISPATSAAPGPREGSRCSRGLSREEITVISYAQRPSQRELWAAGCRSSVTFHESEIQ